MLSVSTLAPISEAWPAGDLQEAIDERVEVGIDELLDAAEVGEVALLGLARRGVAVGPDDLEVGAGARAGDLQEHARIVRPHQIQESTSTHHKHCHYGLFRGKTPSLFQLNTPPARTPESTPKRTNLGGSRRSAPAHP